MCKNCTFKVNFWWTDIPNKDFFNFFFLVPMLSLGQKSYFLGPTIFKIPQPNWYYCLPNNVGLAAQHQNTVFPEFLCKYCYLSVHNYWSSFKAANYYKVFRLTFLLLLCLPNMILDKFWEVGSLHLRSKIIK